MERRSHRVLDPMERTSEVLFGLIMALTFTGSISVAEGSREDVRTLLIAALSCNIAWGVVDGAMYLMGRLAERGSVWRAVRAVCDASRPEEARSAIAGVLPSEFADALRPDELEAMRGSLCTRLAPTARPRLRGRDWKGSLAVFLLVTLSTFPIAIPFLFIGDAQRALRVSNGVAICMLFAVGCAFGKAAGHRPWAVGLGMVGVGAVLVALTIALGG